MRRVVFLLIFGWSLPAHASLPCRAEDALADAAAELVVLDRDPTPEELEAAVRRAGSDLPNVRAFRTEIAADAGSWLSGLSTHADAALVCGEATDRAHRLVIAAPRGGRLEVDAEGARWDLASGFSAPRIAWLRADGSTRWMPIEVAPRDEANEGLSGFVPFPTADAASVQLVATGPAGPRPIAIRWIGNATVASPSMASTETALDFIARERGRARLRPVRINALLSRVAEAQAAYVCAAPRLTHLDAAGLDPQERARRAGVMARAFGEVVARADSRERAIEAAFRSPSHRATLLDARFTDIGVAHAHDASGSVCAVVLFAAWPRPVGST